MTGKFSLSDLTLGLSHKKSDNIDKTKEKLLIKIETTIRNIDFIKISMDAGWQGESREKFYKDFESARDKVIDNIKKEYESIMEKNDKESFDNIKWIVSKQNVIGIKVDSIPDMCEKINSYINAIGSCINGMKEFINSEESFKNQEAMDNANKYIDKVKGQCNDLISQLLLFSDKLVDVSNTYR